MEKKDMKKKVAAKQGALMSLIDAMKGLEMKKIKGFKKPEDKKPAMEAEMHEIDEGELDEDIVKRVKERTGWDEKD